MKIFVTGANGFVGRALVGRLLGDGHAVTGGVGPGSAQTGSGAEMVSFDLSAADSFPDLGRFDAVVHLAAASSSADAAKNPAHTWTVNVVGTVNLLQTLARVLEDDRGDPLLLLVSTGEVYEASTENPQDETSPVVPANPYIASKLAAEIAAFEVARRTRLRLVVARPFPHSGPGQDTRFVVPDFVAKVLAARDAGESSIQVGNMNVARELLHVSDVVDAYVRLLRDGVPGEIYNIARGTATSLTKLLTLVCELCDHQVTPRTTGERPASVLTGDSGKLFAATGWKPQISVEEVVRDVVSAQLENRELA